MGALPAIFSLFLYFNVISGYVLMSDEDNEIIWPSEYHFKGEKINFDTTLKEPFEIWYSAEYNKSRIDFYDGVNRKYYDGVEDRIYTIFPMATSNMSVEVYCRVGSSYGDDQLDFLPDVSYLTFTGEITTLFDKVVDIWTGSSENEEPGLKREETLYVFKTDNGIDIPVQHVIKTLNIERGIVESHTVKNYYNFEGSVDEDDVTPREEDGCYYSELGNNFKEDVHMLHPDIPEEVDIMFESYVNHHSKKYHEKERLQRKRIFEKNWNLIHSHNRKNLTYRMELNMYADRTREELKYLAGTLFSEETSPLATPFPHSLEEIDDIVAELPENFDLRMEGAVTQVKNQGNCGSCWAFATTATLEGAIARATGDRLVDLSEQSVVDCAWSYGNYGCMGGLLDAAWMYVYENGIPTESEYGVYTEHDNYCNIKNMTKVYSIKGFTHVTPRNPNALKVALFKYGPVSVGVQVSEHMVFYSNGIFYDFTCDFGPNHAVSVVGYGTRDGEDYWLVKNSWGEGWGEDGYILMSARKDNCFLLDYPYVPIV